jgi:hypothetical protein
VVALQAGFAAGRTFGLSFNGRVQSASCYVNWAMQSTKLEISLYKAIQTSRLYEQIVQQIEASILKGAMKPGDQLPAERDLAQQFGVSRTAVREAVKALRE